LKAGERRITPFFRDGGSKFEDTSSKTKERIYGEELPKISSWEIHLSSTPREALSGTTGSDTFSFG
jgi:hypothetical protein